MLCLHLLIISLRFFQILSSLWSHIANFPIRHDMRRFVDALYDWCIPRISHNISKFLFRFFSFQISLESSVSVLYFMLLKIFDGLHFLTWTWSHWCHSKFYFCNSLSSMLYLPSTKIFYLDTHCLRGIWIFLYSYLFLLELMVFLLSLSCYACWSWFQDWHTTLANSHIVSVEDFWKLMLWWKEFAN